MIEVTDELAGILESPVAIIQTCRAESWLDDELLASNIPVARAVEDVNRDSPERVVLTIPRFVDGFDWAPGTDDLHPLACNGQRLRVEIVYSTTFGKTEPVQRGWFVVQETHSENDTVTVTAVGLLSLIEEARFASPYEIGGTFKANFRQLVEAVAPVEFDSRLVDRAIPVSINYSESRLEAVEALLTAWAAEGRVTETGSYLITRLEDLDETPVKNLTTDRAGTIIRAAGSGTRVDARNTFVASGFTATSNKWTDGIPVQAVVYETVGPRAYPGPFNPYPVPEFYESPMLNTKGQCFQAATGMLIKNRRLTSRAFDVEAVPDCTLQIGDVVSLTTESFTDLLCTVESLRLPYTPGDGSMTFTVRTIDP